MAEFTALVEQLGDAGLHLAATNAAEGSAGNLSVWTAELDALDPAFRRSSSMALPLPCAPLGGGWVIVTGSGRRLRDISRSPATTLCVLKIEPDGLAAAVYSADDVRPTSELNSHLAIHSDQVARRGIALHAVVHAQPLHLTYLSHRLPPGDTGGFNRRLLRWQPETIMEFPEGLAVLPFQLPGSHELARVTAAALRDRRAVVWQRHGIVCRADAGVTKAADLVDYAETAARYEYLNLVAGDSETGLSDAELLTICERLGIAQGIF